MSNPTNDLIQVLRAQYADFGDMLDRSLSAKNAQESDIMDHTIVSSENDRESRQMISFTFLRGDSYDTFALPLGAPMAAPVQEDVQPAQPVVEQPINEAGAPEVEEPASEPEVSQPA